MADKYVWKGASVVRIGFIVEGGSEKVVIESASFKAFCHEVGVEICETVIDAKGGGNLLPQNIQSFVAKLKSERADRIVVLTDLEEVATIAEVKKRIKSEGVDSIIVAVKALEAWFLADSLAMSRWLETKFTEERPEETMGMPWDRLKEIAKANERRGPGASKVAFAKRFTKRYGFSIDEAGKHPKCLSVKYFLATMAGKFGERDC